MKKYWWLEKYQKLEIKRLPQLYEDVSYFLRVPKNYLQLYEKFSDVPIAKLTEEEMLISLYKIANTKNVKNNQLRLLIQRLLDYADTYLPISDYTLKEILVEIRNLRENSSDVSKLDHNNVAACYHCLQVFYIDKITMINKKELCLCPYCRSSHLYFDNDYIPMNYSFLKLAQLFYDVSILGCRFFDLQKILRKNVSVRLGNTITGVVIGSEINKGKFSNEKFKPLLSDYSLLSKISHKNADESKIIKEIYDAFMTLEKQMEYSGTIYISSISSSLLEEFSLLLLLAIMEVLSRTIYLKEVVILTDDLLFYQMISHQKRLLCQFR